MCEYVDRGGFTPLSPNEGPEKRLSARLMVEDFSGFSGLSGFSVGDAGRCRGAAFSAVFISGLEGERGTEGFGSSSRGGGHACNSKMLAKRSYAIIFSGRS
jgi:hypothetical protein